MHPASFVLFAMLPLVTSADPAGCGLQAEGFKPLISRETVHGDEAKKNAWPWQAFLLVEEPAGEYKQCGAVLLRAKNAEESDVLLTAASCVTTDESRNTASPQKIPYSRIDALIGYHDIMEAKANKANSHFLVSDITIHPDYKFNVHNDIALIKLQKAASFGDNIRPVCLPEYNETVQPGRVCVTAGWGRTDVETYDVSSVLNQLIVEVHTDDTCFENDHGGWGEKYVETEMLCAGSALESGTCHGDEGGMLACEEAGHYILHGITSYVDDDHCIDRGRPSIFTQINSYVKWIRQEINTASAVMGEGELDLYALAAVMRPGISRGSRPISMTK